jgi:hypothetical protein
MSLPTILLFLFLIFGLGKLFLFQINTKSLKGILFQIAVGLSSIPVIGTIFNFLHIPIHINVFIALATLGVILFLIKINKEKTPLKTLFNLKRTFLIFLFLLNLFIYTQGAFSYPWLEDDDSWTHAAAIKHIATEQHFNVPSGEFQYLNPYPAGYPLTFALLHQTNPDLYWILKFFNALIISLSFLFFYLFTQEFCQNEKKAVLATFFLTIIPCYLTHFIWAHSLVITLFFPALFGLIKANKEKLYIFPTSIIISGIFLTQPTQSIKFCILVSLMIAASYIVYKKLPRKIIITLLLGISISLVWWGPRIYEFSTNKMKINVRIDKQVSGEIENARKQIGTNMFKASGGSATRSYQWNDYFFTHGTNMINNPLGVGPTLLPIAIFGLIIILFRINKKNEKEKCYRYTLIFWVLFTILGMNTATFNLPFGLYAFRFWMLFAIPLSLLAAETIFWIKDNFKLRVLKYAVIIFLLITSMLTSGYSKYKINSTPWPWGIYWHSKAEIKGYIWLRHNIPINSKVFAFTVNIFVIGMNMHADFWSDVYKKDFTNAITLDTLTLKQRLIKNNFKYLIVDERTIHKYGGKLVEEKLDALINNPDFKLIYHLSYSIWIFEIQKPS